VRDAGSGVLFVGLLVLSGVSLGDRAAFSCANQERGLLFSPPLDFGRCCQLNVPDLANCEAVCGGVEVVGEVVAELSSAIADGVAVTLALGD
jgi:hypothetical protein